MRSREVKGAITFGAVDQHNTQIGGQTITAFAWEPPRTASRSERVESRLPCDHAAGSGTDFCRLAVAVTTDAHMARISVPGGLRGWYPARHGVEH